MSKLGGGIVPLVLSGLGIAAVLLILLRYPSETPIDVDLQSFDPSGAAPPPEGLRLAVEAVWSPEHTEDDYVRLADYLGAKLGKPVLLVRRGTYGEINDLLRTGGLDFAVLCTGSLLDAREAGLPFEPIAAPVCGGETTYRSYIVVRAKSGYRSIADLAGRSIAFADPLSFTGYMYPVWLLLEQGRDPRTYFSKTTFTHGHDASIHAVLDGSADAAAVDSLVFDFEVRTHPGLAEVLAVIEKSPPIPISPAVARPGTDSGVLASVATALLDMHESREGRAILDALHIDRFTTPATPGDETAERIAARVREYSRNP